MMKRLRRYFLAGLVIVLPVVVTLWLLTFLFTKLPAPPRKFMEYIFGGQLPVWITILIYRTFIIVAFLTAITLLGAFATRTVGAKITAFFQRMLARIPLFNRIYKALQHITSALFGPGKQVFRKVGLIEYPRKEIYTIVFITNDTEDSFSGKICSAFHINNNTDDFLNVFLPTTPNPTSGFFLVLPADSVKILDISVEEALKLVISGGAVRLDENLTTGDEDG